MMPLASTNAWAYRQSHPTYDGRGVLIGVLDSGIDAGIPGLWLTSTGERKLVDLRDFSGEGKVALERMVISGDTMSVGGTRLTGLRRVAALNAEGQFYWGVLAERPLGKVPAADVNGDGDNGDTLPIVVTKASDGWVLFADTDGDGTLNDEKPMHDFLVGKETFGWTTPGRLTPLTVAANFGGTDQAPTLDLFFDTSGHGSHVTGIAAGADLYGIKGFDGVAPGAQVLGLKIANNAYGGISVTGSMVRAIDYAIRFAKERAIPLVLNMSFGVGNEQEGAARIDTVIDSILAANPEVVFVTSAGNDGPGLSTMGFPGSAGRVVTVGATLAPAFIAGAQSDEIAFFSSRGGELDKPDILAPGIAYSSVPRWDVGEETKNGTSMASPHVAGAIGLLLSGVRQEKRTVSAGQLRQAIRATGRALPGGARVDQGAGLLDVVAADRVLRRLPAVAVARARVGTIPAGAGLRIVSPAGAADTAVSIVVEGMLGGPIRLQSSVGWVSVPSTVTLTPPRTSFSANVSARSAPGTGLLDAVVTGWATDTTIGPLFELPITVVKLIAQADSGTAVRQTLAAGALLRFFFPADSGRPFKVRVSTGAKNQRALGFLYEPGGQPYRVDNGVPAGFGAEGAEYEVDARDVVPGLYEAIAAPFPGGSANAEVRVDRSPVTLAASRQPGDTVAITIGNATGGSAAGTTMFGLIGAERGVVFSQRGGGERRIPFRAPTWARRVVVDLTLPRDQWPLFTDLGLTVIDGDGQILEAQPLNYAFGRVAVDLPQATAERDLTVVIAPGFADPNPTALWNGTVSIRLYAETPVLVELGQRAEFSLGSGQRASYRFPLGKIPWALGDGFFPVGNLVVDAKGTLWGREVPLPPATPPVMH
jgi:subtilisin family serine protease